MDKLYFCPNCYHRIDVKFVNGLFRCGTMKDTNKPIDPTLSQEECDRLVEQDLIHGCTRSFRCEEGTLLVCDLFR